MRAPVVRVLLALGLSLGFLAGTIGTGSAVILGPTEIYFPWVPNGAMLGSLGPFYGTVTIQNLEGDDVTVYYKATDDGELSDLSTFNSTTMPLFGTLTLSAAEIGVPSPGSGVIVKAYMSSGGIEAIGPARIAGVQKQASPVAPTAEAKTSEAHDTVAGYTGLTEDEPYTKIVLPIAQTNTGWNTLIRATAFSPGAGTQEVDVTLYEAGSTEAPIVSSQMVAPGATATFNASSLVPAGWVGSAVISSAANIGAVAERVKPETSMLIINASTPVFELVSLAIDGPTTRHAPLVFNNYNSWNTGISIANLADEASQATITYYAPDGTEVDTDDVMIPANGMNFVYTPAISDDPADAFVGAAVVSATYPFIAAVDEVKYLGGDLDTGHAMSYLATADVAMSEETLVLPLAQRGSLDTGMGDTTGIQLFNPTTETVTVVIWMLAPNGFFVMYAIEDIEAKRSHTVYLFGEDDVPDGFYGSAMVQVISANGGVVGVSNNVNYAVQFDGSTAFNLVKTGWAGWMLI